MGKTKKIKKVYPINEFGEIQYHILEDVEEQKKVLEKDVFDKRTTPKVKKPNNRKKIKGTNKKKNK